MVNELAPHVVLQAIHTKRLDYTWIREPDGEVSVFVGLPCETQYLRRVIADQLGAAGSYDYRSSYGIDNVTETLKRLNDTLQHS